MLVEQRTCVVVETLKPGPPSSEPLVRSPILRATGPVLHPQSCWPSPSSSEPLAQSCILRATEPVSPASSEPLARSSILRVAGLFLHPQSHWLSPPPSSEPLAQFCILRATGWGKARTANMWMRQTTLGPGSELSLGLFSPGSCSLLGSWEMVSPPAISGPHILVSLWQPTRTTADVHTPCWSLKLLMYVCLLITWTLLLKVNWQLTCLPYLSTGMCNFALIFVWLYKTLV